jgi:hypothetical protein
MCNSMQHNRIIPASGKVHASNVGMFSGSLSMYWSHVCTLIYVYTHMGRWMYERCNYCSLQRLCCIVLYIAAELPLRDEQTSKNYKLAFNGQFLMASKNYFLQFKGQYFGADFVTKIIFFYYREFYLMV